MVIDKDKFLDQLSDLLMKDHQLSPLAARIYAMLILAEKQTYTFEELVDLTQASKSSVSTQINYLLDNKKIVYETKKDCRKRFFKSNHHYIIDVLITEYKDASSHVSILNQLIHVKTDHTLAQILLKYYQNKQNNIQQTLEKINGIQNQKNDV